MISLIFSHASAKRAALQNPCIGLGASAIIGEHQKRARLKLDRDELALLLTSAPQLGRSNELTIKILLATCVRKGELVRAKKDDVDLDQGLWNVPDENSKMGKGYAVPLAPVVVEWFRELISHSGDSQWVMPARQGPGRRLNKHANLRTINKALERVEGFGIRAFTPHDLRSTARSYLTAKPPKGLGVDVIVAERCLNHALGGLVAIYDQHDYLDERRAALEGWANYLSELEGKPDNVVPLRAAA
jgi:integrase